jgi:hypothetical protein
MKKRYIQPTTEVIELDLSQPMLAGSLPISEDPTGTQLAPEGFDEFDEFGILQF